MDLINLVQAAEFTTNKRNFEVEITVKVGDYTKTRRHNWNDYFQDFRDYLDSPRHLLHKYDLLRTSLVSFVLEETGHKEILAVINNAASISAKDSHNLSTPEIEKRVRILIRELERRK